MMSNGVSDQGGGCVDQIVEKTYVGFMDLEKPYDRVNYGRS